MKKIIVIYLAICIFQILANQELIAKPDLSKNEIKNLIISYANKYNVNSTLALQIAQAESNFNPSVIGTANEKGLYQIHPNTWDWLCKMTYKKSIPFSKGFDPNINTELAMNYLKWIKKYLIQNNITDPKLQKKLTILCYNCGPGKVKKWGFKIPKNLLKHKNKIYRQILNTT